MFRLAHISDPHLPLPPATGVELLSKRITGYLSWKLRRNRIHRPDVLDAVIKDLKAQKPDHVALTGDIVNISLAEEFSRATTWLRTLGAPDWVTVVPGNHDAYVPMSWSQSWAGWADYMADEVDGRPIAASSPRSFPFVRMRGPVALVGTSTALPTPPFMASGRLGKEQCGRLEETLARLGEEGHFRIVLIHHPPRRDQTIWRKSLMDAEAFESILAKTGAELVLHGHLHKLQDVQIQGPRGPVPVVGVPSTSGVEPDHGPERQAAYHLFEIERKDGAWGVRMTIRMYDAAKGKVIERPGRAYAIAA